MLDEHTLNLARRIKDSESSDFTYTPLAEHLDQLYSTYVMDVQRSSHQAALHRTTRRDCRGIPENRTSSDGDCMPAENRLTVHEDMTIYHALDLKQRLMGALEANANLELRPVSVSEIDTAGLQLLFHQAGSGASQQGDDHSWRIAPPFQQILDFCQLTAFFGDPRSAP
jgi:ABC-type transporter Mla MlaB component